MTSSIDPDLRFERSRRSARVPAISLILRGREKVTVAAAARDLGLLVLFSVPPAIEKTSGAAREDGAATAERTWSSTTIRLSEDASSNERDQPQTLQPLGTPSSRAPSATHRKSLSAPMIGTGSFKYSPPGNEVAAASASATAQASLTGRRENPLVMVTSGNYSHARRGDVFGQGVDLRFRTASRLFRESACEWCPLRTARSWE